MFNNTPATLCPCCMEFHNAQIRKLSESNTYQGQEISYTAEYTYCPAADEYYATEQQLRTNDIAMKNAYRISLNRLTSSQIVAIRTLYEISQVDFARILSLGDKTIARYETFQVQTEAHDATLRKVARDPAWYLDLLKNAKDKITPANYEKSKSAALKVFAAREDDYKRNALAAEQARHGESGMLHGFSSLNINKIIDAVNYIVVSLHPISIYTVKLMKLLWYADFLSYKRFRHSITGLAYHILPMGAVPVGYKTMIELKGINYEEEQLPDMAGNRFTSNDNAVFEHLTAEDKDVLDTVIQKFGHMQTKQLVDTMHKEKAYIETPERTVISYKYADQLSID